MTFLPSWLVLGAYLMGICDVRNLQYLVVRTLSETQRSELNVQLCGLACILTCAQCAAGWLDMVRRGGVRLCCWRSRTGNSINAAADKAAADKAAADKA
jgi:hypothetical protein